MNWIIAISLLIAFELIADIFAKEWSLHGNYLWIGALGAYLIANTFWLFALKNGAGLAKGGIIFSVACALLAIILGMFIYKEPVNRLQTAGIYLGIISLVLILWE